MHRRVLTLAAAASVAVLAAAPSRAQSVEEFYKGKDLRVLIGADVGGTYGLYATLATRYLRKYIPGQPNMIIQAMPGAGGITGLNHSYNNAPKDGTLLHLVHAEVLLETLLTKDVKFNAQKYNWIGRFADADFIGVVTKRSGVRSFEDARKRQVNIGSTGRRSITAIIPLMFNRSAGTKFKVIAGYKGTQDISIAMDRGEVDGVAVSWANAVALHSAQMKAGDLIPIFAMADERIKELPDVPTITEFGRDDNEKAFNAIYSSSATIGRALVYPPGVPADRVAALRAAYDKMIKDPEFLAEMKDKNIVFAPMSGEALAAYVDKFMALPPARIEAARQIYEELLTQN
jgi:tripartite-type tricarboxylate transporter receptor subunit TctC